MIVVDASAVLSLLLRTPNSSQVEKRLLDADESLHAPHLIDLEIAQVARRYYLAGEFGWKRGSQVLEDLSDLPLTRYAHDWMLPRIGQLCENLTAYDAAYVVLAEALRATLLTCDDKLASVPGHDAKVEVI